ncbi:hypothetical protein MICAER10613_009650 [Microcystis aeruginosa]
MITYDGVTVIFLALTIYYAEIFRTLRQIRIFKRIFLYITLKWSDREKFSV